jgi:hypothetical protein
MYETARIKTREILRQNSTRINKKLQIKKRVEKRDSRHFGRACKRESFCCVCMYVCMYVIKANKMHTSYINAVGQTVLWMRERNTIKLHV